MNEFEALKTIKIKCHPNSNPTPLVDECLEVIEKALTELKAIKDAEPSEALDKLEECADGMKDLPKSNWSDLAESEAELTLKIMDWVETIEFELFKGKQALLKAEKLEKAWKVVKEKNVSIFWLKECKSLEEYNYNTADYMKLTQEEFNLLKEMVE